MLTFLFSSGLAVAATPPSVDAPLVTGLKAKKDAAVIVMMSDYASLPDVVGAAEDAAIFRDFLVNTRGVPVERVWQVDNGSRAEVAAAVLAAADETKGKGMVWVYFVGHGATNESGSRLLLGRGATESDPGADAIGVTEVASMLGRSRAIQAVVVVDANFTGMGRDGEPAFSVAVAPGTLATPSSERVSMWLAASGAEGAPYYDEAKHGLFSYLVVGSLRGWADGTLGTPADGQVSLQEAHQYVAQVYRQIGGPELKSSRESRGEPNKWSLVSFSGLEAGPDKATLEALARDQKVRRVNKAQDKLRVQANADWDAMTRALEQPGANAQALLSEFVAKYDTSTVMVDGTEVAVVVPQVAEARARLDAMARKTTTGKKKKKSRKKTTPPAPTPAPPSICADLVALQSEAVKGTLSGEIVQCLEERLVIEPVQTNKDKTSRLLMIDADTRGATEEWLGLAQRHLEDIDRSDPDLCFKYALVLSRQGVEDGEEVLKWVDIALENKHVWEGPLYMSRVYNLYRLKTETAQRLWHDAEADYIESRTPEDEEISEKYRGMAKNFAREWLDYARSSGQPIDRPYNLCLSAAGSESFCPTS